MWSSRLTRTSGLKSGGVTRQIFNSRSGPAIATSTAISTTTRKGRLRAMRRSSGHLANRRVTQFLREPLVADRGDVVDSALLIVSSDFTKPVDQKYYR